MDIGRIGALRKSLVLSSVLELISGLFMIVFNRNSMNLMVQILGIVAVTYGLITFLMWLVKRDKDNPQNKTDIAGVILTSVLAVAAGACFIFLSDNIMGIFTLGAGIFAGVFGVLKLPKMFELKKGGFKRWYILLIPLAVIIGLGIVIGLNAFGADFRRTAAVLLGIALIAGCAEDIIALSGVSEIDKSLKNSPVVEAEMPVENSDGFEEKK